MTHDGSIRVTVDTDISYYDQRYCSRPNFNCGERKSPDVVIEFKANRCHQKELSSFVNTFPVRVSRNSKYVNGMESFID